MKQQLNDLMQKEMSRHEFLTVVGFGLVSMLGFSSVLKFMLEHSGRSSGATVSQKNGYGSSAYGS